MYSAGFVEIRVNDDAVAPRDVAGDFPLYPCEGTREIAWLSF